MNKLRIRMSTVNSGDSFQAMRAMVNRHLNNKNITMIENLAEHLGAVPGSKNYVKKIGLIAGMLDIKRDLVDAVIRHDVNEVWKPIKGFSGYKISNYGRVIGLNGSILSSYFSKDGHMEIVDPLTLSGKRMHLSLKKAIIQAFYPKSSKTTREYAYRDGMRVNTCWYIEP